MTCAVIKADWFGSCLELAARAGVTLPESFLEGGMDDEKSMTEKLADALGKATDSVKSTIGNMVDTASNAAQRAMESNAERISGQSAAELDSEQATGSVNGQVYLPAATDAAAKPVPLTAVQPLPKSRKARSKSRATAVPKKALAKKSNKKPAKKVAKKASTKSAPKKSPKKSAKKAKKRAGKTVAKKTSKKSAKARKKSKR
jgi:hypothetical protein